MHIGDLISDDHSDLLRVYSDEGHSVVVETSVKDLMMGETLIAMSDCQPRISLCEPIGRFR